MTTLTDTEIMEIIDRTDAEAMHDMRWDQETLRCRLGPDAPIEWKAEESYDGQSVDGDAVAESLQAGRVEALLEAGLELDEAEQYRFRYQP